MMFRRKRLTEAELAEEERVALDAEVAGTEEERLALDAEIYDPTLDDFEHEEYKREAYDEGRTDAAQPEGGGNSMNDEELVRLVARALYDENGDSWGPSLVRARIAVRTMLASQDGSAEVTA